MRTGSARAFATGRRPRTLAGLAALAALVVVAGCSGSADQGSDPDPDQVDSTEVPEIGVCRNLTPEDVARPSNANKTVECTEDHTAETYKVGNLPDDLHDEAYDSRALGAWAYQTCSDAFEAFLGADESTVIRARVSWAWFRPSEEAWEDGARWYRCDAVGGGEESSEYVNLPETAQGLLVGLPPDDAWMTCANGDTLAEATKVACTEAHTWRAVTTVQIGTAEDDYPGDEDSQALSRDYCQQSVSAWLGYPPDFDYGFTWFGEGQWEAGNRRTICWAKTDQ